MSTTSPQHAISEAVLAGSESETIESRLKQRQNDLKTLITSISLTNDEQSRLKREIARIEENRASLNKELIKAGERTKALEGRLTETEERLAILSGEEGAIRRSLAARQDVLADILAAIQRMGRNPPPALAVHPDDALSAVRSAIVLGTLIPGLQVEAQALVADLDRLKQVRTGLEQETASLKADATQLASEQERIRLLIEKRDQSRSRFAADLQKEQERASELAAEADTLKDLITALEKELKSVADARKAAEIAALKRQADEIRQSLEEKADALADTARIAPAISFPNAKGLLPLPVQGVRLRAFGEHDGFGTRSQGLALATRAAAQVTAPADGWVLYAAPYRSYGQLLILNPGDGYHILISGMQTLNVEPGQFVLAGEPVGTMGTQRIASAAALDLKANRPILYVEFRKDGKPIDPSPWWIRQIDKKVSG
ncbi:murein hydrolase activator EnvC family protein [Coralliovum pocilloporae]|uniref:murein hydrolase activator EnvC family protein n=1 Tax=Coralliovum pocilloporae TaxID=3066369 RepID=UPI0033076194